MRSEEVHDFQIARNCGGRSIAKPGKLGVTGKPFNISSYALFLLMLAHVTGHEAGGFVHAYGDAHNHCNHMDQVQSLQSRAPHPLPQIGIKRQVRSSFDFKYEDFEVLGYEPDPAIRAQVAV